MNNRIQSILQTIADRHGVTVQEVLADMQSAITLGYANPENRAAWNSLGFSHCPSVEEFLLKTASPLRESQAFSSPTESK